MGWDRRTSTFVTYAFRFYKSRNTLHHTHKPNSESISRTNPFSTISNFSQPNLRNPIQESFSRTKPFSKITKLSQSILRNKNRNPVQESISIPKPSSKIFQSNIRNRNPIQKSIHTSIIYQFSQSILRNLHLHNGLKQKNPFLDGAKRFHHHCVARSNEIILITAQRKRWHDSENLLGSAFLIALGVLITLCFGNLETVPYSKRTHVVLLPRFLEKHWGNFLFKKTKKEHEGKILAPDHPNSIRIQRISQAVIEAVKKGLAKEHSDDGILVDDRGIMVKQGKSKRKKKKTQTAHLESFEWEIIVVDKYECNAFCLPGGKIVVYTGLLRKFKCDDEVAIAIGHEVGHALARHNAESILGLLWSFVLKAILCGYIEDSKLACNISDILFALFVMLPLSRRNEMEADYIGMLLAASAGYDPRVAPKVYEKLGELTDDSYLTTHPSGKRRAEKLSQVEVMEKALSIYVQAQAEQAVGLL